MGNFMGYSSATELFTAIGNKIKAKYSKPSGGIPKSDLATSVQSTLGQVSTNQTNILLVNEISGGLNKCQYNPDIPNWTGVTINITKDAIKMSGTASSSYTGFVYSGTVSDEGYIQDLTEDYICVLFGTAQNVAIMVQWRDSTGQMHWDNIATPKTIPTGAKQIDGIYIQRQNTETATINVNANVLICKKRYYDAGFTSYVPYARQNSDLTVLEAEDRAALAEEIDAGAKNEFNYHDRVVNTNLTSFINNGDGSFTAKNNSQIVAVDISFITVTLKSGITYSLSGTPYGGSTNSYSMDIRTTTGDYVAGSDIGEGFEFSVPTTGEYRMCFRFGAGYTIPSAGITFKPMICTKAKSGVSPKFVAYNTMVQWTKVEKEYTSTAADTMEYCGVSFTVPANQIYEFIVMDRYNAGNPKGLGVADNSTNYNSNSTVIAENMADFSVSNAYPWVRQLTGMTVPRSQDTRYHVWVKRGSASKNTIYLMYRRIL